MTEWLSILLNAFTSLFQTRRDLAFENLLLRQQLAVLKEKVNRPQLSAADRSFWILVSRMWPVWLTFLGNHAKDIIATDFFTVPTAAASPRQNA